MNEEQIKERIILLLRLYWIEDLHKIGIELGIQEIVQIKSYWELEPYKAALAISQTITDDYLQSILIKYPPKYITLGGFQGQFYTVTEKGMLSLTSSWDTVRANVKKAIDSFGDRAYGVLRALINKNGSSDYFALIDEIGRVLDYEFVPSYVLPRLTPMKLVFKTGSNKYPTWTIPTEILSVIQDELSYYKINDGTRNTTKPALEKHDEGENAKLLTLERDLQKLALEIVDRKREINLVFQNRFDIKFFNDNEIAIFGIMKPCGNEDNFTTVIQSLCIVLDDIRLDQLKTIVKSEKRIQGSVDLMELILQQHGNKQKNDTIKTLRAIRALRSKKFPIHKDDGRFIEAMKHFGVDRFPPDWQILWEKVLKRCSIALGDFRDSFQ